jgi:hypothetical protein
MNSTDNHTSATATRGSAVTAMEVVLPGVVEPDGLQLRRRVLPVPPPDRYW